MLSEKPWNLEAAALLFLGVICALAVASIPMWVVQHYSANEAAMRAHEAPSHEVQTRAAQPQDAQKHDPQTDFWLIVISAIAMEAPALGLITLLVRRCKTTWKEAFFKSTEVPTAIAYGVMGGAIFVPAGWLLESLSDYVLTKLNWAHPDQDLVVELQQHGLNLPEKTTMAIITIVFAPIIEELMFRGVFYPAIRQKGGRALAFWITSVLFAVVHCNLETFVPLLVFAMMLAVLYESLDNLAAPMVAHSIFNGANFVLLMLNPKR